MNTNDFSKCKVGDKLWFDPLDCEVTVIDNSHAFFIKIGDTSRNSGCYFVIKTTGFMQDGHKQVLYFGKPQIIAPPEPPLLPDYKPGQIIAVWNDDSKVPYLRKFKEFQDGKIRVYSEGVLHNTELEWPNHCTLEELPEVLAKMTELK